jgi:5'-3' exonuclease
MKTNVILDISNILYSNFYMATKDKLDIILAKAHVAAFDSINKYFREYHCDETIVAFDGKFNWRKRYTREDPNRVTHKKYKGQRRQNLTAAETAKLEQFDEHVVEFREILKNYTGLLVLHHENLEADDLIAGYIQSHPNEKHLIVSQDRDYLQLLGQKHVMMLDPRTKAQLTLKEYYEDHEYFMFQKCIRGDQGDNVMSCFPRIRSTKIEAAYTDAFAYQALMANEFEVEFLDDNGILQKKRYKTKEVYWENRLLMDLSRQPKVIRAMMTDAIERCKANRGTYDMFKFLKFCGRNDLQIIVQNISKYSKLLQGPINQEAAQEA